MHPMPDRLYASDVFMCGNMCLALRFNRDDHIAHDSLFHPMFH